jgi:hypothetical protein
VGDFIYFLARLHFGINNANMMFEEWREITARQVTVFVNRRRQHRSAVLPIPGRVIGPAAEE